MPARRHRAWGWAIALLLAAPRPAAADAIDKLVQQLSSSGDYKVRLSAALGLAKTSDPRALPAFVRALRDPDRTVRGVAAAALGKQVGATTPARARDEALAALGRAASGDSNEFVRKQAQKAFDAIRAATAAERGPPAGSVYVRIGPMSATGADRESMSRHMGAVAEKAFKGGAAAMAVGGRGAPELSAKQVAGQRLKAFYLDGTLTELGVDRGRVSCTVSLVLATYPDKSMFGFVKGGAQVDGGASPADVKLSKEDCVAAVMEDVIARKIIPTIQARSQ